MTQKGSVYTEQPRTPRDRHAAALAAVREPPRRSPDPFPDPWRRVMINHVKRFALFGGLMVIVLFISIQWIKHAWSSYDKTIQPRPAPVIAPAQDSDPDAIPAPPDRTLPPQLDPAAEAARRIEEAAVLQKQGRLAEAAVLLEGALFLDPSLPGPRRELGRIYLLLSEFQAAEDSFRKALKINPSDESVLNDLAVSLIHQKRFDESLVLLESLTTGENPWPSSVFNRAANLLQLGRAADAEPLFHRYLTFNPGDTATLRQLAVIAATRKEYREALDYLNRAIESEPSNPLFKMDAATILTLLQRDGNALDMLKQALASAPPAQIYRQYQEPTFARLRVTEIGQDFEREIAQKAREWMTSTNARVQAVSATLELKISSSPQ